MTDAGGTGDSGRRNRLGASGERIAAHHLEQWGYRIVDRNVRRREGEVDLIAIEPTTDTLVLIEVKLRTSRRAGAAVEALSRRKQIRLRELAEIYAAEHPELPRNLRVDLVAIELASDGSISSIEHVESAVEG
jgi:putative endonuclease